MRKKQYIVFCGVLFFPHGLIYNTDRKKQKVKERERMSVMKKFDTIIGYKSIKSELLQIADMYKHRDLYTRLGAKIPRGLLMYGVPGVGKSLMLSALVELIGVKCFVCRKDKPNGDFINKIR